MEGDQEAQTPARRGWTWPETVALARTRFAQLWSQRADPSQRRLWSVFAAAVVWSVFQAEENHSAWGLLFLCLMWGLLAATAHALKGLLRFRVEEQLSLPVQPGASHLTLRATQRSSPGPHLPLALILADALLLCLLQEPVEGPSVTQIQAQLSSLQLVCQTLEEADTNPEETDTEEDGGLTDKVRLIFSFLQQRVQLLSELLEHQSGLEASVAEVQTGVDKLWAQLEEMHTGVTLTKRRSRQTRELPSAQAEVKILLMEVDEHRNKLQRCQSHLKDAIRVLQELTWSHANARQALKGSTESVWPEKLLQFNIEQFDALQEGFVSLEQQALTFRAHLEGLSADSEGSEASLSTASLQDCPPHVLGQDGPRAHGDALSDASSLSLSSAEVDEDVDEDTRLSLCERSARPFSATIGRLHKSRRRK